MGLTNVRIFVKNHFSQHVLRLGTVSCKRSIVREKMSVICLSDATLKTLAIFYLSSSNALTLSQIRPVFYVSAIHVLKTLREKKKLLVTSNFSFSHSVSIRMDNVLPFSSNLKLSSANSFSLEESKFRRLGKG